MAHGCPLRFAKERATELSLELPRYLDELVVPFPAIIEALALVLAPASAASLLLRLLPESKDNLLEI